MAVTAERIRETGLDGPSVAEIMHAAGMTHGGFYKHFDSRDELMLAAVRKAMTDPQREMAELIDGAPDPLAAFVDWYVSTAHVQNRAGGCGVASLAGDVAHGDQRLRGETRVQVERYIELLEPLVGTRQRATVALATLIGAVTVARALDSPDLSEEILRDVRSALKAMAD